MSESKELSKKDKKVIKHFFPITYDNFTDEEKDISDYAYTAISENLENFIKERGKESRYTKEDAEITENGIVERIKGRYAFTKNSIEEWDIKKYAQTIHLDVLSQFVDMELEDIQTIIESLGFKWALLRTYRVREIRTYNDSRVSTHIWHFVIFSLKAIIDFQKENAYKVSGRDLTQFIRDFFIFQKLLFKNKIFLGYINYLVEGYSNESLESYREGVMNTDVRYSFYRHVDFFPTPNEYFRLKQIDHFINEMKIALLSYNEENYEDTLKGLVKRLFGKENMMKIINEENAILNRYNEKFFNQSNEVVSVRSTSNTPSNVEVQQPIKTDEDVKMDSQQSISYNDTVIKTPIVEQPAIPDNTQRVEEQREQEIKQETITFLPITKNNQVTHTTDGSVVQPSSTTSNPFSNVNFGSTPTGNNTMSNPGTTNLGAIQFNTSNPLSNNPFGSNTNNTNTTSFFTGNTNNTTNEPFRINKKKDDSSKTNPFSATNDTNNNNPFDRNNTSGNNNDNPFKNLVKDFNPFSTNDNRTNPFSTSNTNQSDVAKTLISESKKITNPFGGTNTGTTTNGFTGIGTTPNAFGTTNFTSFNTNPQPTSRPPQFTIPTVTNNPTPAMTSNPFGTTNQGPTNNALQFNTQGTNPFGGTNQQNTNNTTFNLNYRPNNTNPMNGLFSNAIPQQEATSMFGTGTSNNISNGGNGQFSLNVSAKPQGIPTFNTGTQGNYMNNTNFTTNNAMNFGTTNNNTTNYGNPNNSTYSGFSLGGNTNGGMPNTNTTYGTNTSNPQNNGKVRITYGGMTTVVNNGSNAPQGPMTFGMNGNQNGTGAPMAGFSLGQPNNPMENNPNAPFGTYNLPRNVNFTNNGANTNTGTSLLNAFSALKKN